MHWFINPIKNHYADFSGRATRKEYWMFMAVSIPLMFVLSMLLFAQFFMSSGESDSFEIIVFGIVFIALLTIMISSISLQVRRLHDIGKSGWWYFVGFIPYIGWIIILVMSALPSQTGTNAYGPNVYEVLASGSPMTPPSPAASTTEG